MAINTKVCIALADIHIEADLLYQKWFSQRTGESKNNKY